MADYDITERRLVVIKPGDILVVGNASGLTPEGLRAFKEALGLGGIVEVPRSIDINAVRYPTADGR
ncbi:hypothetical protein ACIG8S_23570 [[Kitasatospora] papulosa]|uniref:hypothetical protein n=1 Tax=Streptomyces TaxID=1883 RepID=UPI002E7A0CFF|nr:hypothetical protein [Streptomyces sp. JV181]MEE1779451.1 hypothetical protein [Streptomyces sp. JV181]